LRFEQIRKAASYRSGFFRLLLQLDLRGLGVLVFDRDTQPAIDAHPLIREPRQHEECEEIPPPVIEQELESGDREDRERDPVAKAVFAGEDVKELACKKGSSPFAALLAILARLAKDIFLGHRP